MAEAFSQTGSSATLLTCFCLGSGGISEALRSAFDSQRSINETLKYGNYCQLKFPDSTSVTFSFGTTIVRTAPPPPRPEHVAELREGVLFVDEGVRSTALVRASVCREGK